MEMVTKVDGINTILAILYRRVGAHSEDSLVYTLTHSPRTPARCRDKKI
jgi:hypothetical protein